MIETRARNIDGFQVEVSQLSAMRALKMLTRLGRLITPGLAKGISQINLTKGLASIGETDIANIGEALVKVFEAATEDEVESITRILLEPATLNNAPFIKTMDVVLAGKVDTLLKCIMFAIEVNYGSFFAVFRGLGERAPKGESPSAGSNTSPSPGPAIV